MSQMTIKVVAVEVGNAKTKTGKDYKYLDVMYKNLSFDNKAESKKVMPFGSKEVFATLEAAKPGTVFTILREKDKDGYWQWIGIAEGETKLETTMPETQSNARPATATPKSTFETADERAYKQDLIVRQSCLAQAVQTLASTAKAGTPLQVTDVISIAKTYIDFIYNPQAKGASKLPELDNEDIPM